MIDVSNVILETENFILRPFEIYDLEDLYNYAKVEGVGESAGWNYHKSIDETKNILDMFINEKNVFALYHKTSKKVIGSFGLHTIEDFSLFQDYKDKNIVEIGFVLSKDYWGRNLMTEAVKVVCRYLFNDLNYDYIFAAYFEQNNRSRRVQEKCGFKIYKNDIYKINNKEYKSNYTILFKEDFNY